MVALAEKLERSEFPYAEQDPAAVEVLAARLAEAARRAEGETITYSDLVRGVVFRLPSVNGGLPFEIDVQHWRDLDRRILGDMLGEISRNTYREAGFFATAIAVDGRERVPSRQFFKWMEHLGLISNLTDTAALPFWLEQLRLAHAWYASRRPAAPPSPAAVEAATRKQEQLERLLVERGVVRGANWSDQNASPSGRWTRVEINGASLSETIVGDRR